MARAFLPLWKNRSYIIFCWLILTGVTVYREIKQDSHTKHYQSEKRLEATRRIWNNVTKVYFGIKKALNAFYVPMLRGSSSRALGIDQTHVYNILYVSWFCMIRADEFFESRIVHGKLSTY